MALGAQDEKVRMRILSDALLELASRTHDNPVRRRDLFYRPEAKTGHKGPSWQFYFLAHLHRLGLIDKRGSGKGFIPVFHATQIGAELLVKLSQHPKAARKLVYNTHSPNALSINEVQELNGEDEGSWPPPADGDDVGHDTANGARAVGQVEIFEPTETEVAEVDAAPSQNDKLDGVVRITWHTLQTVMKMQEQLEAQNTLLQQMEKELKELLYG